MNIESSKDFIPIFVAIISAMFVFFLGKLNEKNKKLTLMAEESLDIYISKMYKEVIEIANVYNYKVKKIKKFIIHYSSRNDLHKLYDDEINFKIIDLAIKIRTDNITNDELIREFKNFSFTLEKVYWDRLKFSSSDLRWWIKKKVSNKWYSVPLDLLFSLKAFFEYLSVISVILSFVSLVDIFSNIVNADIGELIPHEIRILIIVYTVLILLIYSGIMVIYNVFSGDKDFDRKKIVKK